MNPEPANCEHEVLSDCHWATQQINSVLTPGQRNPPLKVISNLTIEGISRDSAHLLTITACNGGLTWEHLDQFREEKEK